MTDLASQFYAILTNIGLAKQANADALGISWKITHMAVGDANGTDPQPSATQTRLINEVRRAPLNQLKVDPANEAVVIAEQVIPADVGGWWIRELALFDEAGDMVAVANCPPSFKPLLAQGSGRTQVVRMNLVVSNVGNVELKIDPSVVLATRSWVSDIVRGEISDLEARQSGRLLQVLVYNASTTYYPSKQARRIEVEVVGGGGSGGGSIPVDSGQVSVGGGGGGGGYARTILDVSDAMRSVGVAITIGRGGAPAHGTGNGGGTTSFGPYVSAVGAYGGSRTTASSTAMFLSSGGMGGHPAGGVLPGSSGGAGAYGQNNPLQGGNSQGGAGGWSAMGSGGDAQSVNVNGHDGFRGGGGSGTLSTSPSASYLSGKGGDGCCVIREYY